MSSFGHILSILKSLVDSCLHVSLCLLNEDLGESKDRPQLDLEVLHLLNGVHLHHLSGHLAHFADELCLVCSLHALNAQESQESIGGWVHYGSASQTL